MLVALAVVGSPACDPEPSTSDDPRALPAVPVIPEFKTVVEVCDECEWVESSTSSASDVEYWSLDEGGHESESESAGSSTRGDTGGDTDGGTDTDGGGACEGPCPTKMFGDNSYPGVCTEYAPEDCRCLYEVLKTDFTIKVLVTGFADFDEQGEPNEVEDNPSGRLLTGNATPDFNNDTLDGPLVTWLETNVPTSECGAEIEFDFKILPVVWEVAKDNIDYCEYDFVINIGVGGADDDEIDLEQDAGNSRSGTDVMGDPPSSGTIDPTKPPGATISGHDSVRDRVDAQNGDQHGGFTVNVKPARPANCYICNETHGNGLLTLDEEQAECDVDCSLDGVFFIHIPDITADAGLAAGVGGLIENLVQPM